MIFDMRFRSWIFLAIYAVAPLSATAEEGTPATPQTLKPVGSFDSIADRKQRSTALFVEASRVITGPRCMNCHPSRRAPTQGDDLHAHNPPMSAGPDNHGVAGLPCLSCHGDHNFTTLAAIRSIPGDPKWALAPVSMAWQGKSVAQICTQIKDTTRNGGRSLAQIHDHLANDHLVGWAWNPGEGRVPAVGSQQAFGELIRAWIDTGAECPQS